jgi:hypothetical protein
MRGARIVDADARQQRLSNALCAALTSRGEFCVLREKQNGLQAYIDGKMHTLAKQTHAAPTEKHADADIRGALHEVVRRSQALDALARGVREAEEVHEENLIRCVCVCACVFVSCYMNARELSCYVMLCVAEVQ